MSLRDSTRRAGVRSSRATRGDVDKASEDIRLAIEQAMEFAFKRPRGLMTPSNAVWRTEESTCLPKSVHFPTAVP
jgi:hypothetical protein